MLGFIPLNLRRVGCGWRHTYDIGYHRRGLQKAKAPLLFFHIKTLHLDDGNGSNHPNDLIFAVYG